jgi:phage/plasmid-associated DNA primase
MDARLIAFLNKCVANRGELFTHTSMIYPKKKYFISADKIDDFWELYCTVIDEGGIAGINEKPDDNVPIIVDFDFRHEPEVVGIERQYTEEHIKKVVHIYQEVLKDIIADENPQTLTCVVLEKNSPRIDGSEVKDGFHLHFPFCVVEQWIQKTILRERVLDKIVGDDVLKGLNLSTSVDKVIDSNIPGVTWLLYGSRKSPQMEAFKVSHIYDAHLEDLPVEKAFKYEQLQPYRSDKTALDKLIDDRKKMKGIGKSKEKKRKKKKIKQKKTERSMTIIFEDEDVFGDEEPKPFYLPKYLSIRNQIIHTPVKHNIISTNKKTKKRKNINDIKRKTQDEISVDLKVVGQLLGMLKDDKAEDYLNWMEIGWILHNIGMGNDHALKMWIKFSQRSDKFEEGKCEDLWDKMRFGLMGMGTLIMYVIQDSPNEYKVWRDSQIYSLLTKAITWGQHYDIARVLYKMYEHRYVCASIERKVWYEFKNHHWNKLDGGIQLQKKISVELVNEFLKIDRHYGERMLKLGNDEGDGTENDEKRRDLTEKKAKISKLLVQLRNDSFKNSVMRQCMEVFYQGEFLLNLDNNPHLIAFENGVYDLRHGIFREGRPDDYITITTGYPYREYEMDDEEIMDIEEYLKKLFVNKNIRLYFLRFAASCLRGGNINKLFMVWTGNGDNGKSILVDLLEVVFGSYRIKFPTSLITGRRTQSSAATPEMSRIRGIRLATVQEPGEDEPLNVGVLKELSGNDGIYVRGLFKEGTEIKPMFKLVMMCLAGNTSISLPSGISFSISKMVDSQQILSWDPANNEIHTSISDGLIDKGIQECLTLTLEDGRTITCTPNHRFLTSGNAWIEASDIKEGGTKLKIGIDYPKCDDIFEKYNYKFYDFNLTELSSRFKATAFCRLMGMVKFEEKEFVVHHRIDAENIIRDIECVFGIMVEYIKEGILYRIEIPPELHSKITPELPSFVTDQLCPTFLIREYIGSYFGNGGMIKNESIDSKTLFDKLSTVLKDQFNIHSHTMVRGDKILFKIEKEYTDKYFDKIGYRYNVRLSYHVNLTQSYAKYNLSHKISLKEYFKKIGYKNIKDDDSLPCYNLEVIKIENVGNKRVYDLVVDSVAHNFLAGGIVSHNCNKLPPVPTDDRAAWNRIRVLPFESCFVDDAPADFNEQFRTKRFPKDPDIAAKIRKMAQPFMWLLLREYTEYKRHGIREPVEVQYATNKYRKRNDVFLQFIDENIIESDDSKITISEVYGFFKDWYKEGYPGSKIPSRTSLKEDLEKRWGTYKKCWKGFAISTGNDEEEEEEDENILVITRESSKKKKKGSSKKKKKRRVKSSEK